jgi:hypothetical protein
MTQRWSIVRAGAALVAAYALALQALLASFGVGGAIVRHQLAAIAGTICTSNPDGSAPVTPAEHDRADCCILCGAPGSGSIAQTDAVAGVPDEGSSSRLAGPDRALRLGMIARLPGGPRAPPSHV